MTNFVQQDHRHLYIIGKITLSRSTRKGYVVNT